MKANETRPQVSPGTVGQIDMSIIPLSKAKIPTEEWKKYQSEVAPLSHWQTHFNRGDYVGVITGRISKNLEVIDIDVKNDPEKRVYNDYVSLIDEDLLKKLIIQSTPNNGYHFWYRCPDATIDGNQKLAMSVAAEVIIETRGEGGYIGHGQSGYKVIQGKFNLGTLSCDIPVISAQERETLLTLARSLDRQTKKAIKPFNYKEPAINQFNEEFNIIDLFKEHMWTVFKEDDEKVTLTRPDSTAPYSGYYFKESRVFICFSTSTDFNVQRPYNHFQILSTLEGEGNYGKTLKLLSKYGYKVSEKISNVESDDIANYLNETGVRYDTFRQDLIYKGEIISEMVNNTLYLDMIKHFNHEIARTRFEDVIKSMYIKQENPIEAFIKQYGDRQPSGTFTKWLDCINLKNKEIDRETVEYFVKKWYVGMIAQALGADYPNELFLCLLSVSQGVGKTTLLRRYTLPEEMHKYIAEHSLSTDDDFKVLMGQTILIIDDEMDGRSFEKEKTFKSILSSRNNTTRRKYDRRISQISRRCSFAGSGNNLGVIKEKLNRRLLPIEVESIDRKKLAEVDLKDLFMEAYNLYQSGFNYSYVHTDQEKLQSLTEAYMQLSDVEMLLDSYVALPENEDDIETVSNLTLVTWLANGFPHFAKRITVPGVGKLMNERGFNSKRVGKEKQTVYEVSKKSLIVLYRTIQDQETENKCQGFFK